MSFIDAVASQFPLLQSGGGHPPLVYLDSAATSQKPRVVLHAIQDYYLTANANVHRGVHRLGEDSTQAWEKSRRTIAQFFGADEEEFIFTRNTTEAINGVAYGWADRQLRAGDLIVTSLLEHHANFVPWQEVCRRTGAQLAVAGVTEDGKLDLLDFEKKMQQKNVRLVALPHVSNALGTVLPLSEIVQLVHAHAPAALILIDGAQSAPHLPVNFRQLNVDFFAFSGHKMYGPMGSGGLLVRRRILESGELQPWFFGGGMIGEVRLSGTTFADSLADRFTPGTPDVASAAGLAAACDFITSLDRKSLAEHEQRLVKYALARLSRHPAVRIVGPLDPDATDRTGSVTFLYRGVHAHDIAQILDSEGIAVRSGHHCTMPLHEHFGWPATVRASFGVYNTTEDIDALVASLAKVKKIFGK